jgi:hypothetical protein
VRACRALTTPAGVLPVRSMMSRCAPCRKVILRPASMADRSGRLVYSAGGGYLRLSPWTVEPDPLPAVHWTSVTPTLTPQSSNSACRTVPVWPMKVISYVREYTSSVPRCGSRLRAASMPDSRVCVITLRRVTSERAGTGHGTSGHCGCSPG